MAASSRIVSVYGSSAIGPDHGNFALALRLGQVLAELGLEIACGGYGGVMEGISRGAVSAGGRVRGYTVSGWTMRAPNRYLSEECPCSDLYERLRRLIEESDALIALGGGIGTLAEVVLAWNHLYMRLIAPRPLIVVGEEWSRLLDHLSVSLEITDEHRDLITICERIEEIPTILADAGVIQ